MNHRQCRTRSALTLTLGAIASVSLIGCSAYRLNPTPKMSILGGSNDQAWNRAAIVTDTNLRAFVNDGASMWLLDRPSRLHSQPSPY